MRLLKLSFILLILGCHACSSLSPLAAPKFVPIDNENLVEWEVEGSISIKGKDMRNQAYFTYADIDGDYEWSFNRKDPVGKPQTLMQGTDDEGKSEITSNIGGRQGTTQIARQMQRNLPMDKMSYWMKALPATDDARVNRDRKHKVKTIEEDGWTIQYKDYMKLDHSYELPSQIVMKKQDKVMKFDMVRGETGFLASPCPDVPEEQADQIQVFEPDEIDAVKRLVPSDGSAPLPVRINKTAFCKQLYKLHGKNPDPRIGLFGPDSMMWRLSGPFTVAGMGSGRALLLQTAHPWVTAAIDEHSVIRSDFFQRTRRTVVSILTIVYGSMPQVMATANRLHNTHHEVEGKIPYDAGAFKDHSDYWANEANAMIWIHSTLWDTLVRTYEELVEPLTPEEKDQFYEETKLFAMVFGIPEEMLPKTWDEFVQYNESMWYSPQLTVTDNARQLREDLFSGKPLLWLPLRIQETVTAASLPPNIREDYGLRYNAFTKFNNGMLMTGAKFYNAVLPKTMGNFPMYHEAYARIEGKRVGWYQRYLIKQILNTERIVN